VASPPGQPLPPGRVTYTNTWNTTQTCPPPAVTGQPLVPRSNWTVSLAIPTQLFRGQPSGSYIDQSYTVSTNGTFSASDNFGNSFSFSEPSALPGVISATLVGNDTEVVQETEVTAGLVQQSDIKYTFSVYNEFCQPAGLRLEISGSANWGPSGSGTISIPFGKTPVTVSSYRAWFGNTSGVALGFDWSDSKSLRPTFDAKSKSLSYVVGPSFDIDPRTVGTTTAGGVYGGGTAAAFQGQVCLANGRWWVFYYDGTNEGWRSSTDGSSWSSEYAIGTYGVPYVGGFGFFCQGNNVYYLDTSSPNAQAYFNSGTLSSDGSINFAGEASISVHNTPAGTGGFDSIVRDTSGTFWVSVIGKDSSGYYHMEVWYCASTICATSGGSGNWYLSQDYNTGTKVGAWFAKLSALTSGKLSLILAGAGIASTMKVETYSGSAWSSLATTTGSTYDVAQSSCIAILDTTECGVSDGSNVYYLSAPYNSNSPQWSSAVSIDTGTSATISTDGSNTLVVSYIHSSTEVDYKSSNDGGSTWNSRVAYGTSENNPLAIDGPFSVGTAATGTFAQAAWKEGSSSPYNVVFSAIPLVIPTAGTSSNSWGRPGLSPYESYFNTASEYVSPGNGLLTVTQGTFDLPGRGLDLVPSLIF